MLIITKVMGEVALTTGCVFSMLTCTMEKNVYHYLSPGHLPSSSVFLFDSILTFFFYLNLTMYMCIMLTHLKNDYKFDLKKSPTWRIVFHELACRKSVSLIEQVSDSLTFGQAIPIESLRPPCIVKWIIFLKLQPFRLFSDSVTWYTKFTSFQAVRFIIDTNLTCYAIILFICLAVYRFLCQIIPFFFLIR